MTTTMLARPAVRPCTVNPPQWWDTYHAENPRAIALCADCPFRDGCEPDPDNPPSGVIRAGRPYGDDGSVLPVCPTCRRPRRTLRADTGTCGLCVTRAVQARSARKPPSPAEHREMVIELLSHPTEYHTYGQVAERIGCTPEAVAAYWQRQVEAHGYVRTPQRTGEQVIAAWAALRDEGLDTHQIAARLDMKPDAIRAALRRARRRGDSRVPAARPTRTYRRAAT